MWVHGIFLAFSLELWYSSKKYIQQFILQMRKQQTQSRELTTLKFPELSSVRPGIQPQGFNPVFYLLHSKGYSAQERAEVYYS